MRPALALLNRQRTVRYRPAKILALVQRARPACMAAVRSDDAPLAHLAAIEATLVSDRQIARVHGLFFDDPTPTDVITFPHGEILLGAGVITENAARFGKHPDEEAALCFIHGLLHLAGWDDRSAADARAMARMQEQVFNHAVRML